MGDGERRTCDPQGCASLQVVRREVELYADSLKDVIEEYKSCLTATKDAIAEMKVAAVSHAEALKAGTREFNIINDEIDHLREGLQDVKTRVAVLESGGTPVNRSAAGWGATLGGIVSAIAWAIGNFFGGQ